MCSSDLAAILVPLVLDSWVALANPAVASCASRSALRRAATFLLLQVGSKHSDAVTSPYDPGMSDTAQPKLWHPLHDSYCSAPTPSSPCAVRCSGWKPSSFRTILMIGYSSLSLAAFASTHLRGQVVEVARMLAVVLITC